MTIPYYTDFMGYTSFMGANYKYNYPKELKLKPGSPLHNRLLSEITARAEHSHSKMSTRYSSWQEVEKTLTAYIYTDDAEKKLKAMDPRKPVSMVLPFSYAILETLCTYMTMSFLEHPYFTYDYTDPDDAVGVALLEKVVEVQMRKARAGLNLMTAFKDSFRYGLCAIHPIWDIKTSFRQARVQTRGTPLDRLAGEVSPGLEEFTTFEGSRLININPYNLLLDTNVSSNNIHNGEFIGFVDRTNLANLLTMERNSDRFFNGQYMKHISGIAPINGMTNSKLDLFSMAQPFSTDDLTRPIDIYYLFMKIIPKDWDLGDSEIPEIWFFAVAGGSVIIACDEIGLWHGKFPIEVGSPDFDGYTPTPVSRIEINHDSQLTQNFLMNSHIANVRKAVNNMIVYDPSVINPIDMESSESGMRVRARKRAWGSGTIKDSVFQLAISDITQNNLSDISYLAELAKQSTGAVDNLQGVFNQVGDRRSATEARDVRSSAMGRMEMAGLALSMQLLEPLAEQIAYNTQQFMSEKSYAAILGRYEEILRNEFGSESSRVPVYPSQIDVAFEVMAGNGVLPTAGDTQSLLMMFQIVASDPLLRQEFEITRIFQTLARASGFKNVQEYTKRGGNMQAGVVDNEVAMQEAQKGNIASLEDFMGAQNVQV